MSADMSAPSMRRVPEPHIGSTRYSVGRYLRPVSPQQDGCGQVLFEGSFVTFQPVASSVEPAARQVQTEHGLGELQVGGCQVKVESDVRTGQVHPRPSSEPFPETVHHSVLCPLLGEVGVENRKWSPRHSGGHLYGDRPPTST